MPTRKVDLEKERLRAKKPGAGYPSNEPPRDPIVDEVDKYHKKKKLHPAEQ